MLPPSYAQELLWLLDRAAPGDTAYNVPSARLVRGPLRLDALRRAFDALAERHEVLRTTYGFQAERPVQVVHPPRPVPFEVIDASGLDPVAGTAEAHRHVRRWSARPFDLATETPLRAGVVKLSDGEHILHVSTHHIAFDGWSRGVLERDLGALYAAFADGRSPALPELPIQYADYAIWQRRELEGGELERLLGYWREELRDVEFGLGLTPDVPARAAADGPAPVRSLALPAPMLDDVRALGRRFDATTFVTLLAAYHCVLHRYTGRADVLVGTPVAGRSQPETESLIGHFLNTTVQRARFAGDPTFAEVLAAVREGVLRGFEHQAVPFEKLALDVRRDGSAAGTLFDAVFTSLEPPAPAARRLGDLETLAFDGDAGTTKFALTLFMAERADGLTLTLRCRASLWRPETVERFLRHLRAVLESALLDPHVRVSRLAMLDAAECADLARRNANAAVDLGPPATIASLFAATVLRVPGRIALVAGAREATYAELDALASRFAARLLAAGVRPGEAVGIFAEVSVEAITALLGIAKAGAAFVPLSLPAARLAAQAEQSGIRFAATSKAAPAGLPSGVRALSVTGGDGERPLPAFPGPDGEALAYVLFTSGSTGVPKGVAVLQRSIVAYARGVARVLTGVREGAAGDGFAALDGLQFASVSPLTADLGYTALFPALFAGATLHLVAEEVAKDRGGFAAYVRARPLDVLKITPSHLRALLPDEDEDADAAAVLPRRALVTGGELLTLEFAARLRAIANCRIFNHYGPTETTVGACTFEVTAASLAAARADGARSVPVGRPLAGVTCEVRGPHGELVPGGVPGELYVGGTGVARGYVGGTGGEVFVSEPPLGPVYRTGDRVRGLADGALEFLGRIDAQVKVRGHRVEPGEIEAVLGGDAEVAAAAVRVWNDGDDVSLAAYVVPQAGVVPTDAWLGRLRRDAAERLPEHMLPRSLTVLTALPLTRNGKLDRAALPPAAASAAAGNESVPPRTATEAALAAIWAGALRREPASLGVRDDFIALGGHSLAAIRILGAIGREFGVRLPLRALFDMPTVEQLAAALDAQPASARPDEPALVRLPRTAYRRPSPGETPSR